MRSALFIRGGALGDFILTLPSIRAFRQAFPTAHIEILGYPHIAHLALGPEYAAAVRSIDQRGMAAFFAEGAALDPGLCAYVAGFDLVVSFLYDPDEVFRRNLAKAGARRVLAADSRPSGERHAAEHLAAWLEKAGVAREIEAPCIFPSEIDLARAAAFSPPSARPRVAIHLGSGSPVKNWPVERFAELARCLAAEGIEVLVVEGPADEDAARRFWSERFPSSVRRCAGLSLPQLAALFAHCAAFVGHDSGITHLAAAVGTPVCAIFGPTDARVWRPRGKRIIVLQRGERPAAVSADEALRAVLRLVSGASASAREPDALPDCPGPFPRSD